MSEPLRVGIGGPVGAGKTTLVESLCRTMSESYEVAVVTNDIYTREDAEILWRSNVLPRARIVGVETGGCPHTAIREDASLESTGVIMLTGIGERLNEMTSPLYGADGFLDKPFELDDLTDKVRQVLADRTSA